MERKPMPVGHKDIEIIRELGCYYVDKTLLIKDIIDSTAEVILFTRPRRFGKTMNMYMLKRFLECDLDAKGQQIDHSKCFEGLKIMSAGERYMDMMGKVPVIFITLSGAKALDYKECIKSLSKDIVEEFKHHCYLLTSDIFTEQEKVDFNYYYCKKASSYEEYADAFLLLSNMLTKYHGIKPLILVDEYDVPLQNAMLNGFGKEMTSYIRRLFENTFKKNPYLGKGIITGCLRIAKESIFTGMNNLDVIGIMDKSFAEYFGFTRQEVEQILVDYELEAKLPEIMQWYDGYTFGEQEIFNPWSAIMYIHKYLTNRKTTPAAYWANTSGNDIIKRIFALAGPDAQTQKDLDKLMSGGTIVKKIYDHLTYDMLGDTVENVWSVMFATGYLTMVRDFGEDVYELRIPNGEVMHIYEESLVDNFLQVAKENGKLQRQFCEALETGDIAIAEQALGRFLRQTVSLRDTATKSKKENFYHGIILGFLSYRSDWRIYSNVEAGMGYADIIVQAREDDFGMIIEVKYADSVDQLATGCAKALEQIELNDYAEEMSDSYITNVQKYGISCYKKKCCIANYACCF